MAPPVRAGMVRGARTGRFSPMSDIPRDFNAAAWFVDRHVREGRGGRLAIVRGGRTLTYGDLAAGVNRVGNALTRLGVRMEQRVMLLLPDCPEFVYAFWGALKIGAVPVPTNTLLTPRDYEYILNDSRAEVAIVGEELAPAVEAVRSRLAFPRHLVVAGRAGVGQLALEDLVADEPDDLAPAGTTKDDVAFWLYTSGTTGTPKAAVHLHHDMLVCCEGFGRHVLEIGPEDRTFSVAKLFFAYAALLQVAGAQRTYDLSSVRLCLSAGEPLPRPIYERWRETFGLEILDGIGSTEMCHTFIANRRGQVRHISVEPIPKRISSPNVSRH